MQFALVHEIGLRQRWKTRQTVSKASARVLEAEMSAIDGVDSVSANPVTGSVVVVMTSAAAKARVLTYFAGLVAAPPILRVGTTGATAPVKPEPTRQEQKPDLYTRAFQSAPLAAIFDKVRSFGSAGSRKIRAAVQESSELDFAPLVHWVAIRPIQPMLVNTLNTLLGAVPYVVKGIKSLFQGKLNVDVLDAAAIGLSILRRDFKTASVVMLMLGLGEMLERYTRKKTLEGLTEQLAIRVDKVWVRQGENLLEMPLKDIGPDDRVVVRAGSVIPVDGTVVAGDAAVNQATMTGEPLAVHRTIGSSVFAGTVVEDGEIDIAPTSIGDGTRLNQIVKFIETSEQSKAGIQGKAEKIADAVVPFNFGLAALVFLVTRDWMRATSVLMVDYSCALRLATPLAILTSMKQGTERGIVVKGGRYLEALAEVDTVVFDKTGTLTHACPRLTDVVALDGSSSDELLRLAACLEEHFPHPVSRAIVERAHELGLDHGDEPHDASVQYIVAHGICSSVDGENVILGGRHFVEDDEGVDMTPGLLAAQRLAEQGKSILYMARGGRLVGVLGIEDPVREEAARVIRALRERGVKRVVMLTGDDEKTASVVANALDIDDYRSQVLPTDKAAYVHELKRQGARVLMVGDGINDSPALSASDVAVTLSDGSAIAQEVADVVLTNNVLSDLPEAIDLARATMRRIRQNFGLSVGLNSAFMAGGLTGLMTPAVGALLHNATTIGVCLNAMRSPTSQAASPEQWLYEVLQSLEHAKDTLGVERLEYQEI